MKMNALKRLLSQRQKHSQEVSGIMNPMVIEAAMVMDFIDTSDEPQGRGSRSGKSSNHHRQRLSRGKNFMENYFVDRPIFSEDDFHRRYRMLSSTMQSGTRKQFLNKAQHENFLECHTNILHNPHKFAPINYFYLNIDR